jgi:hypothetical protein
MRSTQEWLAAVRVEEARLAVATGGLANMEAMMERWVAAIQADAVEAAAARLEADLGHGTWAEGLPLPPQEVKWVENIRKLKPEVKL